MGWWPLWLDVGRCRCSCGAWEQGAGQQVAFREQELPQVGRAPAQEREGSVRGSEVWVPLSGPSVMLDSGTGVRILEGLRKVTPSPEPGRDGESGVADSDKAERHAETRALVDLWS